MTVLIKLKILYYILDAICFISIKLLNSMFSQMQLWKLTSFDRHISGITYIQIVSILTIYSVFIFSSVSKYIKTFKTLAHFLCSNSIGIIVMSLVEKMRQIWTVIPIRFSWRLNRFNWIIYSFGFLWFHWHFSVISYNLNWLKGLNVTIVIVYDIFLSLSCVESVWWGGVGCVYVVETWCVYTPKRQEVPDALLRFENDGEKYSNKKKQSFIIFFLF